MDKEILNLEEASELFNVSVKTFIKLLKEEKVPGRKIGREWRFSRMALINWLSSGDSQIYSSSEGEIREFFNQVAPEWEELSREYYDRSVVDRLLDSGLLKKTMTVLDLGAGSGYLSRTVAPHVKKVVAVDISSEMLKELEKRVKSEGLENIRTMESDGCDLPLEDAGMDMVCANMYLHHIEEPALAIREMKRVLKPGGMVFLADFKKHSQTELKEKMHDHWMGFKSDELKKWFEAEGFREVRVSAAGQDGRQEKRLEILVLTAVKE